jgi:hypothetical protein
MDDDMYADFITEVLAGGFAPPPAGQLSAEEIAAHVARNHEELIRITETILSGYEAGYDNGPALDPHEIGRYVLAYRGLRGLADRLAVTVVTLRELARRMDEHGSVTVPVRIYEGGLAVDGPMPWDEVLKLDESSHVRRHLEEIRALRAN